MPQGHMDINFSRQRGQLLKEAVRLRLRSAGRPAWFTVLAPRPSLIAVLAGSPPTCRHAAGFFLEKKSQPSWTEARRGEGPSKGCRTKFATRSSHDGDLRLLRRMGGRLRNSKQRPAGWQAQVAPCEEAEQEGRQRMQRQICHVEARGVERVQHEVPAEGEDREGAEGLVGPLSFLRALLTGPRDSDSRSGLKNHLGSE